jgi:hypothetical protein
MKDAGSCWFWDALIHQVVLRVNGTNPGDHLGASCFGNFSLGSSGANVPGGYGFAIAAPGHVSSYLNIYTNSIPTTTGDFYLNWGRAPVSKRHFNGMIPQPVRDLWGWLGFPDTW